MTIIPLHAKDPPDGPVRSYRLRHLSNRAKTTSVVAVAPARRDIWAILRGRYVPKVRVVSQVTAAGYDKVMRDAYADLPTLLERIYTDSPFRKYFHDPPS